MWIQPEEVLLVGALWVSERANPFFILQRRRGHGRGGGLSGECLKPLNSSTDGPLVLVHSGPWRPAQGAAGPMSTSELLPPSFM